MQTIIDLANKIFEPIIKLGAAPIMLIVLTVIAFAVGVNFFHALEGGIKLAIAITAISSVIGLLTDTYQPALNAFVKSTGINLSITDLGWAPLATITWGSPYTLFFLAILVIVNLILLFLNRTNTLDVDIFDIWHLSFTGLLAIYFGANLFVATVLVIFIGVLKIINSDLMKPTFNDLLDDWENPMTTTHLNYMMNPVIMVFDKLFDKLFPWLDKYDFDAAKLNEKIGFWGSRFAIGIYLGIFIGLISHQDIKSITTLAFMAATCLELFSIIGSWFIAAVEPLSQGVADFANKRLGGRMLNIGLDWPFLAGTLSAPFITHTARALHASGIPATGLISSSTKEGPIEQFIAVLVGKASKGEMMMILYAALALIAYTALFFWYRHEMMKRNQKYSDEGKEVADDVKFVATHAAANSAD